MEKQILVNPEYPGTEIHLIEVPKGSEYKGFYGPSSLLIYQHPGWSDEHEFDLKCDRFKAHVRRLTDDGWVVKDEIFQPTLAAGKEWVAGDHVDAVCNIPLTGMPMTRGKVYRIRVSEGNDMLHAVFNDDNGRRRVCSAYRFTRPDPRKL